MTTTFAPVLTRYYHRVGNRIIFCNGATLNQLALAISEKLNSNFDPATLSRVVSGRRLFTASQLRAFCAILRLSKEKRLVLTKSLAISLLARAHIKRTILYKKSLYTKMLEFVIQAPHRYIRKCEKNLPELALARAVMEKIGDEVKQKYPTLWKNQQTSLLCCRVQKKRKAQWMVFTP